MTTNNLAEQQADYVELPADFCKLHSQELCEALDSTPEVSIRLNPHKPFSWEVYKDMVEWCDMGRYLEARPLFTLDPIFAAGGYYVQEASSMMTGSVSEKILEELGESEPLVVDLCAAPGGKSTHLMSVVGEYSKGKGVVVANEVIKQRAGTLAQNVVKWGEGNGVVTSVDVKYLGEALSGRVDILVVDAPCSGEGMFRKDMAARQEWSLKSVELCAGRQKRILSDAQKMLKSGGYLIYSTCTFNRDEDEGVVEWLLKSGDFEGAQHFLDGHGEATEFGSHFYPDKVRGEGFFISVLRYIGDSEIHESPTNIKGKKGGKKKGGSTNLKKSAYSSLNTIFEVEQGGKIYGYSRLMNEVVEVLQNSKIYILMAGIEFGELIRGELKPAHSYALYAYNSGLLPHREVSLEVALEYLRKSNSLCATEFQDGLQIVTYQGLALGYIKRIGNRVNSGYPTSWRIVNL